MEGVERLAERLDRRLLRLVLGRRVRVAGADVAGVVREAERAVSRSRQIGIERADDVEHRAVHHRALFRLGRIELVEMVDVAEILHDCAALQHHALRQVRRFDHRRQMRGILADELGRARLAVDVVFGELELGGAHEHARRHVVHARLDDMQLDRGHGVPPTLLDEFRRVGAPVRVLRRPVGRKALGRGLDKAFDRVGDVDLGDRPLAARHAQVVRGEQNVRRG